MDDLAVILRRLEWPGVEMPYSMTLVEGIDEDVIRRLGGDPERTEPMVPELYWERHLDDAAEERCFVGVATALGGIVVAVEHTTYAGNVPGVLPDLSAGGQAFNMLNHINAKDSIGYAVDGDLIIFEEPWGSADPAAAQRPALGSGLV